MLVSAWPGVSRMHLDDVFSELGFGFRITCWVLDLLLEIGVVRTLGWGN